MSSVEVDGDAAPVGKRERNKAEKLRRITDAAVELFDELGFEATTTAAIAARAGVGAGTLYLYVGSKDDLLVRVFRDRAGQAWSEAFAAVDEQEPVDRQLLAVFASVALVHAAEGELAAPFFKVLQFVEESARGGADELLHDVFGRLDDLIRCAQDNGSLDPEVTPRSLSDNLFAIWYVTMQRHFAGRFGADELVPRLERAFETALRGLLR